MAKKSTADLTANMTNQAQGERMSEVQPASLADAPGFPNLWPFVGSGLGIGLILGLSVALWTRVRSKVIRATAEAVRLP